MAVRRLPLHVDDASGARHRGELLFVRDYTPDLELNSDAAFTIVIAQQPLDADSALPSAANVAVCAPAAPVRLPASIGEAKAAYDSGEPPAFQLPRAAVRSYATGSLLAAQPLSVTAADVFAECDGQPRLDALVGDLVAASQRAERYWGALSEALSQPNPPARQPRRDQLLNKLRALLQETPQTSAYGQETFIRLQQIVDGTAPARAAASPAALADDVAFVRCLAERPKETADLASMRAYMDGVHFDQDGSDVASDYPYTREQLSFVAILERPHELDGMRATFEAFRSRYASAYETHHTTHWQAVARLNVTLEDAAATAEAIARLNGLRALGRPLAEPALEAYTRLRQARRECSEQELAAALKSQPACPQCSLSISDRAPLPEAKTTLRQLDAALSRQQSRLASEAVRRILARGGRRLEQFLQIVQASDLTGLAHVLDGDLLEFLRELLSEPVAPTAEALDLFEELARSHPVVSEEQVDAVTDTLRTLLTEQLASQKEDGGSAPATFRLASIPPPQS